VKIEQTVEVEAPLERVWALINDVPRVAHCMPGAELTRVVDDHTYEGTIRVKLGPINMSYKGTAVLQDVDEANHTAKIAANGKDVRGGGTARAGVDTTLQAVSDSRTRMAVNADVQLTGKVASFGRGAIQDVSAKLFGEFASCLRQTLEEEARGGAEAASAVAPETQAPPAEAPAAGSSPAEARATAQAAGATAGAAAAGAPTPASAIPPPAPRAGQPIRAERLAGTAIAGLLKHWWATLVGFLRRLFGRR
jgi:carbon monoxide dehydrogenase subunit G